MKDYIHKPFYDVDYCKYADWGYRKRTRTWTNLEGFDAKICNNDCNDIGGNQHKINIGHHTYIKYGDNIFCHYLHNN